MLKFWAASANSLGAIEGIYPDCTATVICRWDTQVSRKEYHRSRPRV
jgi:hypothetical protein